MVDFVPRLQVLMHVKQGVTPDGMDMFIEHLGHQPKFWPAAHQVLLRPSGHF